MPRFTYTGGTIKLHQRIAVNAMSGPRSRREASDEKAEQ